MGEEQSFCSLAGSAEPILNIFMYIVSTSTNQPYVIVIIWISDDKPRLRKIKVATMKKFRSNSPPK